VRGLVQLSISIWVISSAPFFYIDSSIWYISYFSIALRSYEWPSYYNTGSVINSSQIGQINLSGASSYILSILTVGFTPPLKFTFFCPEMEAFFCPEVEAFFGLEVEAFFGLELEEY
jgi:hypothetical protein